MLLGHTFGSVHLWGLCQNLGGKIKHFGTGIIFVALSPASQPVGWDGNRDRENVLKPRLLNWESAEFIILMGEGRRMETIKVLINKVIYFIQKYLLCAWDSYKPWKYLSETK